jgi:hypothetical protein
LSASIVRSRTARSSCWPPRRQHIQNAAHDVSRRKPRAHTFATAFVNRDHQIHPTPQGLRESGETLTLVHRPSTHLGAIRGRTTPKLHATCHGDTKYSDRLLMNKPRTEYKRQMAT